VSVIALARQCRHRFKAYRIAGAITDVAAAAKLWASAPGASVYIIVCEAMRVEGGVHLQMQRLPSTASILPFGAVFDMRAPTHLMASVD